MGMSLYSISSYANKVLVFGVPKMSLALRLSLSCYMMQFKEHQYLVLSIQTNEGFVLHGNNID